MLVLIWRNENENFYFSDFQTFIFFPSGFCLPDTDNLHELVSFSCFVDTFLFSKGLRLYSAADSKWVPLVHEHNSFNKWMFDSESSVILVIITIVIIIFIIIIIIIIVVTITIAVIINITIISWINQTIQSSPIPIK